MDLGIKDKTALVLGAGGGLGGAIAASLAQEGARVVAADLNLEAATATADRIKADGLTAIPMQWDLRALDAIDSQVAWICLLYTSPSPRDS